MQNFFLSLILLAISIFGNAQQVDWAFGIGGNNTDVIKAIETDQDGNTFITGEIRSLSVDFDPGVDINLQTTGGTDDVFVAKYDINGVLLWAKVLPSTSFSSAQDIATDLEGRVYVTGNFNGEMNFNPDGSEVLTSGLQGDAYVVIFDGDGTFDFAFHIVGDGPSIGIGIDVDEDYNIYLTGTLSDSGEFNLTGESQIVSLDPGGFFLAKYSENANLLWAWGITAGGGADVKDMDVTASGEVVLTGAFQQEIDLGVGGTFTSDEIDSYVMKVNATGNVLWGHAFTGNLNQITLGTDMNGIGEVYVCGDFTSEIDLDPTTGTDIVADQTTQSGFITKLAANGDYLWGRTISNQGDGKFIEIDQDFFDASVYVTGNFNGTITLPDASIVYSNGGSDILSVQYSSSGDYEDNLIFGGTSNDAINTGGVSVHSGDLIIGGHYFGTIDFGLGEEVLEGPMTEGMEDFFLVKYAYATSVPEIAANEFSLYPNPANDYLNLATDKHWNTFVVRDLLGRIIDSGFNESSNFIDITDLSSGTYALQFYGEDEIVFQGLVIVE